MSQHPPVRRRLEPRRTSIATIELDLMQEKASALGRLGRQLEADLKALADFDAGAPGCPQARTELGARESLVVAAAGAFWNLLVQREACGFLNNQAVIDDYKVPAEVHRRAGVGLLTWRCGRKQYG